MTLAAKGELTGECARQLCRCTPARWHDHSTGRYVCEGCAADENGRAWRNRPDGSPCCQLNEGEPEPKPVPITGYYEDPFDSMWP